METEDMIRKQFVC